MRSYLKAVIGILAGSFIGLSTLSVPASANITRPNGSYADEQALVAQLTASRLASDKRKLAELFRAGLMASADNPLRVADRLKAIDAYRQAIDLGDRSAGTSVSLARLLLRENEAEGMADLRPVLRNLVLQGNGDAAYVLVLDAAQNQKLSGTDVTPKLEAAAVLGSVPAVVDLLESGTLRDGPAKEASLAALEKRAMDGWGPASYALYQAYKEGKLVAASPQKAMQWLRLAVEQGHLAAFEKLAENLLHGEDIPGNVAEAASLYRRAAEAGSASSALALGRSSASLSGMEIPPHEARMWLSRAAEIGFDDAAMELTNLDLAEALRSTATPEEKMERIATALSPIADDPDALANLANKYWKTSNSSMIGPALLSLLKEHALQRNPSAGLAYDAWLQANGEAMPEDVARALVEGLKKQPLRSVAFSSFLTADLALNGRISEDVVPLTETLRLLTEAADAKVGQAMLRLGNLYQQGDVLAQNRTFAKRWFEQAKAQAVEQAAWDLAALQTMDDDKSEREEGERFYLKRLDDGDVRAGLALVRYRLKNGDIDGLTLAQVKRVVRQPIDMVELASLLVASGREKNVQTARQLLDVMSDDTLDVEANVSISRLQILISVSDAEAERGLDRLEKAAESGAANAKIALASTYLSSVSYREKQAQAIDLLQKVLIENPRNHDARLLMSKAYLMGLGIKRDAEKASELIDGIRAEGEYRNPKATMLAADWLAFSASDRNPLGAEILLKAQAARGSVAADRALGDFYLGGFAPTLEPDVAAARLYRAANAGDKEAMTSLGHLLINGYGLSKSQDEGMRWLKRAAEAGNTAAMYELSRIFALEPTGQVDGDQVIYWLTRAANRNHPNASYQLGLAYFRGEWVPADTQQALVWFGKSASAGNLLAARTLDTIRTQISEGAPADISRVSNE